MELRDDVKNALSNDGEILKVSLSEVEAIIASELYKVRVQSPQIKNYGTFVATVISDFMLSVQKQKIDLVVYCYWKIVRRGSGDAIYFNGKIAALRFFSHLLNQPRFVDMKHSHAVNLGIPLKYEAVPTDVSPIRMVNSMADALILCGNANRGRLENDPEFEECKKLDTEEETPKNAETEVNDGVIEVIACIGFSDIAGAIAKNCYQMHPFHNPESVYRIIRDTFTELREFRFMKNPPFTYAMVGKDFECLQSVRPADLFNELNRILMSLPDFRKLNLSLVEKRADITDPDDPSHSGGICFVSRYGGPAKENDFIDLDACSRNIYLSILEDCLDEEVDTLRNKRFNVFPWLTPTHFEKNDKKEDQEEK